MKFQEYDVVKLKCDHASSKLEAGAEGTVVVVYDSDPPHYEVEFCDESGVTLALLTLSEGSLQKATSSIGELRNELQSEVSLEQIIVELARNGESIMNSIKLVRAAADISLGEAKRIVSAHPVWQELVEESQQLHDDAEAVLRDSDASNE